MGTVYARGRKLWVGYKDERGEWVYAPTSYVVGEEEKAKRALAAIERRIAAADGFKDAASGVPTLESYGARWLEARRKRAVSTVEDDAARLRLHVYPALGRRPLTELRPRDFNDLFLELRDKEKAARPKKGQPPGPGKKLAPKTIHNVYATVHALLQEAVIDELIQSNPCVLRNGVLPPKVDQDPEWRDDAVFTRAEVERIISDERIPFDRRVCYALLFVGAVRFGEAAALRWRNYDASAEPLGKLLVAKSYNTKKKVEKSVKTNTVRRMPVHSTLAKLLGQWKLQGWPEMFGRRPEPDDLVVPSRLGKNRSVNHMLKRFHEDLERVGLRLRRQHDLRRTFISLAQEDGGIPHILKWGTHGRKKEVWDDYTSLQWKPLCDEVAKLRLELVQGQVIALPKAVNVPASQSPSEPPKAQAIRSAESPAAAPSQSPSESGLTTAVLQTQRAKEKAPSLGDLGPSLQRGGRDSNPRRNDSGAPPDAAGGLIPQGCEAVPNPTRSLAHEPCSSCSKPVDPADLVRSARHEAVGLLSSGRVQQLEDRGLVVVRRADLEDLARGRR